MVKPLPMDPRGALHSSDATIHSIVDAIVELVTNSDDSYKRLEETGKSPNGRIEIHVWRRKGGRCDRLIVKDWAEGMTKKELEQAICFSRATSGFEEGKSVRGMFGRGLKEAILALRQGKITTIKNGRKHRTVIWRDSGEGEPGYDDEMLERGESTSEENGTEIDIKVTNRKMTVGELKTLSRQISQHYALRDITQRREVVLFFTDLKRQGRQTMSLIRFQPPFGDKVVEKEVTLPGFDDKIKVIVYESKEPLEYSRYDPSSLAGILIKAEAAILDNQLFKFAEEEAARYFFGEAICDCLTERMRTGDKSMVDYNRAGLDWRHDYCKSIAKAVESVLAPLIQRKKATLLSPAADAKVKESTKKMLKKLCAELNRIAKEELEDLEQKGTDVSPPVGNFVIKPEYANIPVDGERSFSLYASKDVVSNYGNKAYITVENSLLIRPLTTVLELYPHHRYEDYYYNHFKVVSDAENEKGRIIASLGDEKAYAEVKTALPKKRKKRDRLSVRKGGFITDIRPDNTGAETGKQRSRYDDKTGIIWVNVNFPSVKGYLKAGFEGVEKPEARILLAEIVGEAFCKALLRKRIERGNFIFHPGSPEAQIEAYNNEVNNLQRKYLHLIQGVVSKLKLGKG